jgi:hypothetical protein
VERVPIINQSNNSFFDVSFVLHESFIVPLTEEIKLKVPKCELTYFTNAGINNFITVEAMCISRQSLLFPHLFLVIRVIEMPTDEEKLIEV